MKKKKIITKEKMICFVSNYEKLMNDKNYEDCFDALIFHKIDLFDVNAKNENGDTLLNIATKNKLMNLMLDLLEMGADPDFKNNDGENMLFIVEKNNMLVDWMKKASQRGWSNFNTWENFSKKAHHNTKDIMFQVFLDRNTNKFSVDGLPGIVNFLKRNNILSDKTKISLYASTISSENKYQWFKENYEKENIQANSLFFNNYFKNNQYWWERKEVFKEFIENREIENNLNSFLRIREIFLIANKSKKNNGQIGKAEEASYEMGLAIIEYVLKKWNGLLKFNTNEETVDLVKMIDKVPEFMQHYMDIKLKNKEELIDSKKLKI